MLHVEVYQNETEHEGYLLYYSVLFVVFVVLTVIKSVLRIEVRDKKNLRIVFDQRRRKLRRESHAIASKENDNQLDFGTAF